MGSAIKTIILGYMTKDGTAAILVKFTLKPMNCARTKTIDVKRNKGR